jgi:hypothetical protein
MAVVNTKATAITTGDASPPVPNQEVGLKLQGGRIKECVGTVEAGAADSIASTYRLCRVPSSVRISQVLLSSDAVTSAAADIGVCETSVNGGAAVDADLFASAASLATAQANVDVTHESGSFGIEAVEKQLWELLGLSKDPGKAYDITATLTAAATAAGTVSLAVRYVDGN